MKKLILTVTLLLSINSVFLAQSSEAQLSSLSISGITIAPSFSPDTLAYKASVNYSTKLVEVNAVPKDANASLTINGNHASSGQNIQIELMVGTNAVSIDVTAEDGITKLNYKISVVREPEKNLLKSLTFSNVDLDPSFSGTVFDYKGSVADSINSTTLIAIPQDSNAVLTVNGNLYNAGTTSPPILLNNGQNEISVEVSNNTDNPKTYLITIDKKSDHVILLDSLSVNIGLLSPAFDPNIFEYNLEVAYPFNSITIEAFQSNPNAMINGTGTYDLNVGENIFKIDAFEVDSMKTTYTITVNRHMNALLSSLSIVSPQRTIPLVDSVFSYTVNVPDTTSSVSFIAIPIDPMAIFMIGLDTYSPGHPTLPANLVGDSTTIRILVITGGQYGVTRPYDILVRKVHNSAPLLDTLTTSPGELTPAFDPYIFEYNLELPLQNHSFTIDAYTSIQNAIIIGTGTFNLEVGTTKESTF